MQSKSYYKYILCQIFSEQEYENMIKNNEIDAVTQRLEKTINTLSDREIKILFLKRELNYSFAKTGVELGVTAERIRQLEIRAFRRLRHPVKKEFIKTGTDLVAEQKKIIKQKARQREEYLLNAQKNGLYDKIKIETLEFSVRTYNCLRRGGYETLEDLISATEDDFLKIRNMGYKSIKEVKDKIADWTSTEEALTGGGQK